jgi:FkbM family methyltransferase
MSSAWYNMIAKIPFGYTKKVKQGREVAMALKKALDTPESVFIDVGCHRGAVLNLALKIAPKGDHYAFEAIPAFYEKLIPKFKNFVYLKNTAITNYIGETEFTVVESNPALSGIKERDYPKSEKIVKIRVATNTLDNALSACEEVQVIRIDVEGGEYDVIDGAKKIIFKHKPIIMFEHQQGAADYYKNGPEQMWDLIVDQLGMKLFTLSGYVNSKKEMTESHFKLLFETGQETLFVASYQD